MTCIIGEFFFALSESQSPVRLSAPAGDLHVNSGSSLPPYDKPWLSISEQVNRLASRGLVIDDRKAAEAMLWHLNYYRFSGYCLAFETNRHQFREGTKFGQVIAAYQFDVSLRDLLTEALEVIEVDVRASVAHCFGEKAGAFGYLDEKWFRPSFDHDTWMKKVQEEVDRSSELFVAHFQSTYSQYPNLPFWIATEIMSFGAVSKVFGGLLDAYQKPISARYNMQKEDFASALHHLTYVRNVCAHHCRLWDRVWGIWPRLPAAKYWHPPLVPDAGRLFVTLLLTYRLLKRCSGQMLFANEWRRRFNALMRQPPETDGALKRMGMPNDWYKHPLWV